MNDTIGNPGRADVPVTRIEGDAEDLIAYFDEQAARPDAEPIYNNFRALVDIMDGYDLDHDEIEIIYSFRAVNPPAPEYTQVGNYVLAGEIEVPPTGGSADTSGLIDLITAFFAASGDMNLSRVVGADNAADAAADRPPYLDFMLKNVLVSSYQTGGADADADFLLII